MNFIERLKIQWVHFKLLFFNDVEFKRSGVKYIPCYECGEIFLSYRHFHNNYDSVCRECLKKYGD